MKEVVAHYGRVMNWIKSYFMHLYAGTSWAEEMHQTHLPSRRLKAVVEMIDKTRENELTCAQVHVLLGEYAERVTREVPVDMPLVSQHLDLCRECLEEYQALERILKAKKAG